MRLGTHSLGTMALGGGTGGSSTVVIEDMEISGDIEYDATLDLAEMFDLFFPVATISYHASLSIPPQGTKRTAYICDIYGQPLPDGGLSGVEQGSITWRLNHPTKFTMHSKSTNRKIAPLLTEEFQEVRLKRGNMLLTGGPVVTPTVDDENAEFVGYDPLWYLKQLHVGRARRRNWLLNGSFENGYGGWNFDNYTPVENGTEGANPIYILESLSSERAVTGKYSLRVETPSDEYPKYGANAWQYITWEVEEEAKAGDEWSASVKLFIPGVDFRSLDGAGLKIERYDPANLVEIINLDGVSVGFFPSQIESVTSPLTEDTERDGWFRTTARLHVPRTGNPELLAFRVMVPKGVIHIDDAILSYNERLEWFATDQATIATDLILHGQDPAYDKVDLNITVNAPATGVLRDLSIPFSDHTNILQALESLTALDDGFDMRMVMTDTTRAVTLESPSGGSIKPKFPLQLRAQITRFKYTFDGEFAANAVLSLGDSYGGDREEGFADDTSAFANGIVLEQVFPAPPGTPTANLDNIATERLAAAKYPVVLEFWTGPNPAFATKWFGSIKNGDILPVTLYHGPLEIPGVYYRLVEFTLDPDDNIHGTLNLRSDLV